jgi:hypothetical protein
MDSYRSRDSVDSKKEQKKHLTADQERFQREVCDEMGNIDQYKLASKLKDELDTVQRFYDYQVNTGIEDFAAFSHNSERDITRMADRCEEMEEIDAAHTIREILQKFIEEKSPNYKSKEQILSDEIIGDIISLRHEITSIKSKPALDMIESDFVDTAETAPNPNQSNPEEQAQSSIQNERLPVKIYPNEKQFSTNFETNQNPETIENTQSLVKIEPVKPISESHEDLFDVPEIRDAGKLPENKPKLETAVTPNEKTPIRTEPVRQSNNMNREALQSLKNFSTGQPFNYNNLRPRQDSTSQFKKNMGF